MALCGTGGGASSAGDQGERVYFETEAIHAFKFIVSRFDITKRVGSISDRGWKLTVAYLNKKFSEILDAVTEDLLEKRYEPFDSDDDAEEDAHHGEGDELDPIITENPKEPPTIVEPGVGSDDKANPSESPSIVVEPSAGGTNKAVEFYVKMPDGMRTITLVANPDDTCDSFMLLVKQATGFPCQEQRLITSNDITLESGRKLRDYHLPPGSKLQLALRIHGAGKRGRDAIDANAEIDPYDLREQLRISCCKITQDANDLVKTTAMNNINFLSQFFEHHPVNGFQRLLAGMPDTTLERLEELGASTKNYGQLYSTMSKIVFSADMAAVQQKRNELGYVTEAFHAVIKYGHSLFYAGQPKKFLADVKAQIKANDSRAGAEAERASILAHLGMHAQAPGNAQVPGNAQAPGNVQAANPL